MTKTIREVALDLYKPPFTYEHGYVFDSTHQMVADSGDIGEMRDLLITRIRGWGRIQYMDNPKGRAAALQDEVGQIVVEALNAFWAGEAQAKPTATQAHALGAKGAEPTEAERVLFEAWMAGHCWAVSGTWDGKTYVHEAENGGFLHPPTMNTRQLWAAWRDRGALAQKGGAA